jgi:hypothetical protein
MVRSALHGPLTIHHHGCWECSYRKAGGCAIVGTFVEHCVRVLTQYVGKGGLSTDRFRYLVPVPSCLKLSNSNVEQLSVDLQFFVYDTQSRCSYKICFFTRTIVVHASLNPEKVNPLFAPPAGCPDKTCPNVTTACGLLNAT